MSRRATIILCVAGIAMVVVWWLFVYSPMGDDISETNDAIDKAELEQDALEAELASLEEIEANGPEIDAELARLTAAIPTNPDLAAFIVGANDLAVESGLTWLSVSPSEPASGGPASPTTVTLTMELNGGFFQVLDYLNGLEDIERLVVVDGITVAAAESDGATSTAAPDLNVTLNARMFTSAPGTTADGGSEQRSSGSDETPPETTAPDEEQS